MRISAHQLAGCWKSLKSVLCCSKCGELSEYSADEMFTQDSY